MKFLAIYTPDRSAAREPSPELQARMGAYVESSFKSGVLLATGGVGPTPAHAVVRRRQGKLAVVDGPFAEAKELIGGFALLEARDLPHCVELVKEFLGVAGDGESEIFSISLTASP